VTEPQTTDVERIARFRQAAYGGAVADALAEIGVLDTVLSAAFRPLRPGMVLVGRALPVKIHARPDQPDHPAHDDPDHPQKQMMQAVARAPNGTVLCFDCSGDRQVAHFGELSAQVAHAHGAHGMLVAGNVRDVRHLLALEGFPVFSLGTRPNAAGGWGVIEVGRPVFLPGHLRHYVTVAAGDYVFGDDDGVQVIPAQVVDDVLQRVERIHEKETHERAELAAGMPIDEVYRIYGAL
jgi:regulator of RNase E activity RraA